MMYQFVRSSLADITRDLNKASETVITGKRINTLSDDPMDMAMAAGIKSTLDGLKQMDRNISMGNSWLTASESALTHAQDLISETKTLALQMANAPISSGNRKDAAVMVEQTMEQIMSLANTMVDGRYVFSGNRTDVPSFAVEMDGTGENIVYQGDNHPFSIKIGTDSLMEIGGDGGEIFTQIFDTLAKFKTALEEDDLDGINSVLGAVAAASNITGNITTPGDENTSAEIEVTFTDLLEGQTFTAAGRTITAGTGGATADQVAEAFATGSDVGNAIVSATGEVADGSLDGYSVTQGLPPDNNNVVILTASENGEVTSFTVTGGTAIVSLDEHFDHLNSAISAVGSRMNRLDMKSSLLQEMKINETQRLSALEDADIIEAITRLEQMQLSYQAALSSSSKLMSMNLLDYLK
jgi:flagellar hook-associated protein 3 FlgL